MFFISGMKFGDSSLVTVNGVRVDNQSGQLGGPGVVGDSGPPAVVDRPVQGFSALKCSGLFEIEWSAGSASASVEAPANLQSMIKVESSGGALAIRTEGNFTSAKPIKIKVSSPSLSSVELFGSVSAALAPAAFGDFQGRVEGVSVLNISGSARACRWETAGSGGVNAKHLSASLLDIVASGSSTVVAAHERRVDIKASGSSDVAVKGGGEARIETSGSAQARQSGGIATAANVSTSGASNARLILDGRGVFESSGASSISCLCDNEALITKRSGGASSIKVKPLGADDRAKLAAKASVDRVDPIVPMPAEDGLAKAAEAMRARREGSATLGAAEQAESRPVRNKPVG